jgi:hypothetical protein
VPRAEILSTHWHGILFEIKAILFNRLLGGDIKMSYENVDYFYWETKKIEIIPSVQNPKE